jgi:hypothetical protein
MNIITSPPRGAEDLRDCQRTNIVRSAKVTVSVLGE